MVDGVVAGRVGATEVDGEVDVVTRRTGPDSYALAVAVEVEPPELALLLDAAERPRAGDWSLRAALTRYAQPQPQRASDVIELLRRAEAALKPHQKRLEQDGPAIWSAVSSDAADDTAGDDAFLVGVLRALGELDALADTLAAWAVDRRDARPDAAVDRTVAAVTRRFDELGVPREERTGPPSGPGSRRRPAKRAATGI